MKATSTYLMFLFSLSLLFFQNISAQASLLTKENDMLIIDNGNLKFLFSADDKFKLIDIQGKEGSWLVGETPLWKLTLLGKNGVNPQVDPSNGIYKGYRVKTDNGDNLELVFTWQMRLSKNEYYQVRVNFSTDKNIMLSEWSIEADMPKDCIVSNVEFPIIMLKRTNATKAIIAEGWGVEFDVFPSFNYTSEYASHNGGMQFLCYHRGKEALYFATHDKTASIKNFKINSCEESATIKCDVPTSEAWTNDGVFRMPWKTTIGLNSEGWEKAVVDWYRPFTYTTMWGKKPFNPDNYPKWLLNTDLWLRPDDVKPEVETALKKALQYFGAKRTTCHWYRWHQIEYDVDYPEFFPPKADFPAMISRIQKLGTHITPYINGRLWDPASKSYKERNGASASCRKADGTLYTEVYGSKVANSVTCPSTEIWQNTLANLVERMQNELGVDGVYIDQICAGRGVPCFAENHKHPRGGGEFWHTSYRELLEKVRAKMKKDNILYTEENAECFLDLFDVVLMVNTPQKAGRIIPLFPMVYSDRVIYNGFLYYPEPVFSLDFRLKNAMALLWGSQLGWIQPEKVMDGRCEINARFLKEMTNFREKQHDIIYGGQFVKEIIPTGDNPILKPTNMNETPAVRAALWKGRNNQSAIFIVNIDDNQHVVNLPQKSSIKLSPRECLRIDLKD
jgi:hypothetical protein